MPVPADPAGRRANGLQASDWGALVDLDPRLSEGLLDRLADAGVAAYVEPATAVDTVHRAVTMPPRPLDRLWVDPSRADSAREVVASEVADLTALLAEDDPGATAHGLVHPIPRSAARRVLPPPALPGPPAPPTASPPNGGPAPSEPRSDLPVPPVAGAGPVGPGQPSDPFSDDDVFAELVRRFHSDEVFQREGQRESRRERRDQNGDAGPRGSGEQDQPRSGAPARRRPDPAAEPPAAATPMLPSWVEPEPLDDDGHFVPPPPPPVPRIRARTVAAVASVVLGLLVLFAPAVLGLSATGGVGVVGLALLAGGAGALVWWLRDSSGGPDDGAVV